MLTFEINADLSQASNTISPNPIVGSKFKTKKGKYMIRAIGRNYNAEYVIWVEFIRIGHGDGEDRVVRLTGKDFEKYCNSGYFVDC